MALDTNFHSSPSFHAPSDGDPPGRAGARFWL
jgi:hypothetical protein